MRDAVDEQTVDGAHAQPGWVRLLEALIADADALGAQILARILRDLPAFSVVDAERMEQDVALSIGTTLRSAQAGSRSATVAEVAALQEVGRSSVALGIDLETMLRAWRLGVEVTITAAHARSAELGAGRDDLFDFFSAILTWSDLAMVEVSKGHRAAELAQARADEGRRGAFIRALLDGSLSVAEVRALAGGRGSDGAHAYRAIHASVPAEAEIHACAERLGLGAGDDPHVAMLAILDGHLVGFATRVPRVPAGELCAVGPAGPLERLSDSARLARRAFTAARGFGLSGLVSLDSLGLRAAVAGDRDVGDTLTRRYLAPLEQAGAGLDLLRTLDAFLSAGQRVEAAARALVIHPNTLRYRLARFEELTGRSFREPETAFELWWALERHRLAEHTGTDRRPGAEEKESW
ncbi:CdaR family transcriptional regulator [Conexibacter sp. DBS9H8]|uniref:PucR family transcriptional regulator n=1 Tax=Conexibacter sp. DBS9H8 TaxID=2937801 RepID=UPI00200F17EA|nr:helix-turn-helix domain-containing protein [Conexibacter sp. DBS9H8]